jgi:hypothetical protein
MNHHTMQTTVLHQQRQKMCFHRDHKHEHSCGVYSLKTIAITYFMCEIIEVTPTDKIALST